MTASPQPLTLPTTPTLPNPRTALFIGLAVLGLAYWPTWTSFVAAWIDQREQGFLVSAFCLWFAWRNRSGLLLPGEGVGLAAIPLAFLSLLWLVGIVLSVRLLHQAAVPVLLLGWVLSVAGLPAMMAALPIVGTFFLLVPFWGLLSPPLQSMTVAANSVMLGFTDIDAKIEGSYIAIPSGVFEVAGACSGVKYLESGVIIAVVYGLLFLRTWRARAVAVAIAALLSMVSNWLRVVGLIIIGHRTQMQSPLIADHDTYGWIIFAVTLSVFFVVARRIEAYDDRLSGGREQAASTSAAPAAPTATFAQQLRAVALPTGAAVLGPLLWLGASTRTVEVVVPEQIDGLTPAAEWTRDSTSSVTPLAPLAFVLDTAPVRVPGAFAPTYMGADLHLREFWHAADVPVQVDRLVYREQSQDRELINSQNRIAPGKEVLGGGLVGPIDDRGRMVTATIVRPQDEVRLVWSWFSVAGVRTHSRTEAKLLELVSFTSPGHTAELVTVSTPCGPEDCNAATQALFRFVTGRDAPPAMPSAAGAPTAAAPQ
jgi:exosortase